jgi:hypothetical protein
LRPVFRVRLELETALARAVRSRRCSIGREIFIGTRESLTIPEWNPD